MNIPDWVWVVGSLSLLLLGLQLGVSLGRAGEKARQGDAVKPERDDKPRATPQPKVDWSSINLDLSSPAKDKASGNEH